MSKLWRQPRARARARRGCSASSMVRPKTNWRPRIFIAWRDRGADHRLAEPPDGAAEHRAPIVAAVVGAFEHLAGQQQREGRGVDEGRVRLAELLGPVRARTICRRSVRRRCARRGCAAAPRRGTSARCPRRCRGHRRAGRRRAPTACAPRTPLTSARAIAAASPAPAGVSRASAMPLERRPAPRRGDRRGAARCGRPARRRRRGASGQLPVAMLVLSARAARARRVAADRRPASSPSSPVGMSGRGMLSGGRLDMIAPVREIDVGACRRRPRTGRGAG